MKLKFFSAKLFSILVATLIIMPTIAHANECTAGESAYAGAAVEVVSARCCSRPTATAKNRCVNDAIKFIRNTSGSLTPTVTNDIIAKLTALRDADCNAEELGEIECTDELSATVTEIINLIRKKSCSKKYTTDRLDQLKKLRRPIVRARQFLGADFSKLVLRDIRKLRNAKNCGAGGESKTGCTTTRTPYDGAKGYLWKPFADHNPRPVWLSPRYRGPVTLITPEGKFLSNMAFTGIANSNRAHYRPSLTCQQMPGVVYVKEGTTCFIIDGPCRRHD